MLVYKLELCYACSIVRPSQRSCHLKINEIGCNDASHYQFRVVTCLFCMSVITYLPKFQSSKHLCLQSFVQSVFAKRTALMPCFH